MVESGGDQVLVVLLYGSQLLKTRPDTHSAFDLVVLVRDYRSFYGALKHSGELHRPVWLMTWLAGVLAPNTIAFVPDDGRLGVAKCLILTPSDFERALSPRPPDHFLLGRLVQRVGTLYSASREDAQWVEDQLAGARSRVLDWMTPYLDRAVDGAGLGRRLLEVCYQGELRPEARARSEGIYTAQVDHFLTTFDPVLRGAAESGLLTLDEGGYRLTAEVPAAERRKWRRYFRRSKARATLRWFKHMVTFANWLPYIVRKVERHSGREVHLTALERKLPIVFLWPRAIHVLLTRPQRENER